MQRQIELIGAAWGLGGAIYDPLRASALAKGLRFHKYAEARQLVLRRRYFDTMQHLLASMTGKVLTPDCSIF